MRSLLKNYYAFQDGNRRALNWDASKDGTLYNHSSCMPWSQPCLSLCLSNISGSFYPRALALALPSAWNSLLMAVSEKLLPLWRDLPWLPCRKKLLFCHYLNIILLSFCFFILLFFAYLLTYLWSYFPLLICKLFDRSDFFLFTLSCAHGSSNSTWYIVDVH